MPIHPADANRTRCLRGGVSTGNYADIGQTLGAQTGENVSLQAQNSLLQTITDTNQTVATRLSPTETILGNLRTNARIFSTLLENNGSTSNASAIQATGQSDLQDLISSLNSSLNGDYIFGGTNTGEQPITDYYATSAPNKSAVNNAFLTAFGMSQTSAGVSTISGVNMQNFLDNQFAPLFQGSNWTTNWSSASSQSVSANSTVFQQLAQAYTMVADLGTQNLSSSAYQAVAVPHRVF